MESGPDKPPVARLLGAGVKGAERMAQVTGVDRALDQAVEEALLRALRSPAIRRAIARAVESESVAPRVDSEELGDLTRRALDSDAAARVWAEFLASEQAQMLVERIASAPEIRAAITAQSAGLITDLGIRLTKLTEGLDDALERVVRRDHETETNQAGLATRALAAAIDLGLLFALYSVASGVIASIISGSLSLAAAIALGSVAVLTGGGIIVAFWALLGQTPGMRFLAIRLTQDGARDLTLGRAVRRLLGAIVSLLPLGLGYLAILRNPSRHAWHDRMTNTEVIYDAVARTAPYSRRGERSAAVRAA